MKWRKKITHVKLVLLYIVFTMGTAWVARHDVRAGVNNLILILQKLIHSKILTKCCTHVDTVQCPLCCNRSSYKAYWYRLNRSLLVCLLKYTVRTNGWFIYVTIMGEFNFYNSPQPADRSIKCSFMYFFQVSLPQRNHASSIRWFLRGYTSVILHDTKYLPPVGSNHGNSPVTTVLPTRTA